MGMDSAGGRLQTHAGRSAVEAKDGEAREVRHARCMTEILAALLINALLRKGVEKVEIHHAMLWFMVEGPPYEYSHAWSVMGKGNWMIGYCYSWP